MEVLDLRGRLDCAAKDEARIPAIFELPAETRHHALLLESDPSQAGPKQHNGSVAVPPDATSINLKEAVAAAAAAAELPTAGVSGDEASFGRVCILEAGTGALLQTVPVPLLSPDTLAVDPSTGAVLVAGGGNRVMAVLPCWENRL